MKSPEHVLLVFFFLAPALWCPAAGRQLEVVVANPLDVPRTAQTIELSASELAPLGATNMQAVHVRDAAGTELLCQAVDTDFDALHRPNLVIFQADFAPGEIRKFTVVPGTRQVYRRDQFKAHGRFVRERFDDCAWENDRIAHRMYGKGLETWAGEPLTSSTVDIWSKRVPQMVIDEWYMVDNYHSDTGQGADFYSAGKSRGCGGNGLWVDGQLWVSANFIESRVLANGPIRISFELVYAPFDVKGVKVSEVKRITLDAGSNLDRFQSFYRSEGEIPGGVCGIGLKKVAGERTQFLKDQGALVVWQKMEKDQGMQGLAVVVDPKSNPQPAEDRLNNLVLARLGPDKSVSYWAGFCWDKAGQFATDEAWRQYVSRFAQALAAPLKVTITAK